MVISVGHKLLDLGDGYFFAFARWTFKYGHNDTPCGGAGAAFSMAA